jgi:hypothetical protein
VKGYVAVPKDQAAAKQRQLARLPLKTPSTRPCSSRLRYDRRRRLKPRRLRTEIKAGGDHAHLVAKLTARVIQRAAGSRFHGGSLRHCFRLIAARQNSRAIAQDHQTFWIIFNGGFVERARRSKIAVPHEDAFDAGALATIAK